MRLVDAEAKGLLMELSTYSRYTGIDEAPIETAVDAIHQAPTIDAVPVVRCADCKCWTEWANGTGSCSRFALDWIGTDADDFCSFGEREDDGRTD